MDKTDDGWECPSCGVTADEEGNVSEEDEYDFIYGRPDGIPSGCVTCGGDYPNCKDSCNLFDD
jgi:hypothetical protein